MWVDNQNVYLYICQRPDQHFEHNITFQQKQILTILKANKLYFEYSLILAYCHWYLLTVMPDEVSVVTVKVQILKWRILPAMFEMVLCPLRWALKIWGCYIGFLRNLIIKTLQRQTTRCCTINAHGGRLSETMDTGMKLPIAEQ